MEKEHVTYRMAVIGGSAGSLEVILQMIPYLPLNSSTSIVLVVHRKNNTDSILDNLISTRTTIPVKEVEDKEPILPGNIYIAPPDYHLLLEDEHTFSLDSSEKIHFSRPSIDVTFESAAEIFGPSLIGILLSGANADGAKGLQKLAEMGGKTIVQSPESSEVSFMPEQAIKLSTAHEIIAADQIGARLIRLINSRK